MFYLCPYGSLFVFPNSLMGISIEEKENVTK